MWEFMRVFGKTFVSLTQGIEIVCSLLLIPSALNRESIRRDTSGCIIIMVRSRKLMAKSLNIQNKCLPLNFLFGKKINLNLLKPLLIAFSEIYRLAFSQIFEHSVTDFYHTAFYIWFPSLGIRPLKSSFLIFILIYFLFFFRI